MIKTSLVLWEAYLPESSKGRSQSKGRFKPKGRLLDAAALEQVKILLGDRVFTRDQLIEYLHIIQDHDGYLSDKKLGALAHLMRISMAEIWEVASFYDHFTLVKDNETPPAPRQIRICTSLSCMLAGAEELYEHLKTQKIKDVDIIKAPCMGACDKAPACADGQYLMEAQNADDILSMIKKPGIKKPGIKKPGGGNLETKSPQKFVDFENYREAGGYRLVQNLRDETIDTTNLWEILENAALRGLGGAGFPLARKWKIVAGYEGARLMAINGDEGEPGTFKDRFYLSYDPHRTLEGILIAAHMVGVTKAYIYIRDEYPEIINMLRSEIDTLQKSGLAEHVELELRRGAGAYICGEESAMIESIEGKRGLPRHRPPYVAEYGLFGRPTLVNNVETLYWVRDILEKGADWFNAQGSDAHPGFRSYSVSGRVKCPQVIRMHAGASALELIQACGGMKEGHEFKAYLPGGASGGILPAKLGDIPLDFGGKLAELGCFVGSHAVIILSHQDNIWKAAINLMQFFAHESCGQCTPCRAGTDKAVGLMTQDTPDQDVLKTLAQVMHDASICGLGQAAPNPLLSAMTYFPEDIERR